MGRKLIKSLACVAVMAAPIIACDGTDPLGDACCTDFKVGADLSQVDFGVEADIKGQYVAFAQASADLAGTAQGMIDDVSGACKAIAQAGGANADKDDGEPGSPKARVEYWCNLASARIDAAFNLQGGAKLNAMLDINITPAECKASFKAEAKCQASCDVSGKCDAKATPPTCEGGKLEVSCSGSCEAEAGASISCEGGCTGQCEGSCSAEGGVAVNCEGQCDGTCEAGGSAGGTGVQADGSCNGTCKGTCTAKAGVKAQCSGTCKGSCDAKCEAKAGATVKCDGKCTGTAEPLSCKGGELKAKCEVDANCSANCKGSAEAKAECTPPKVDIQFKASAQASATAEASLVLDALRVHLPNILLVFEARGKAFADLVVKVSGSGSATLKGSASGKLGVKGTACLIPIANAIAAATENASASFQASGQIAGKLQ